MTGHRRNRIWTESEVNLIQELRNSGMKYREIIKEMNLDSNENVVRGILRNKIIREARTKELNDPTLSLKEKEKKEQAIKKIESAKSKVNSAGWMNKAVHVISINLAEAMYKEYN